MMKTRQWQQLAIAGAAVLACTGVLAQQKMDLGKREYDNN